MKDIHGQAILDYFHNNRSDTLIIHNNYEKPEEMPVEVFFRNELDFTVLENLAIMEASGKVLDLGAGAGAISLALQRNAMDVAAIENSPGCVEVMSKSGVEKTVLEDFEKHHFKYDTIIALMNGLGMAGTLANVPSFLQKLISMLNTGGQLLIDSSDISYLYENGLKKPGRYYGEVQYQYEYKGKKGDWFDWVYVDQQTLQNMVNQMGLQMEVLHTEETGQYLCRITMPD